MDLKHNKKSKEKNYQQKNNARSKSLTPGYNTFDNPRPSH